MADIGKIRNDYKRFELLEENVAATPIEQFKKWLEEAIKAEVMEPTAMTLATVSPEGMPSQRTVLLKDISENGFTFFTNYNSRKGKHIETNNKASLLFFWPELERQVRVEGTVTKTNSKISDTYFHSRPKGSRIGAFTSPQSQVIPNRAYLDLIYKENDKKFKNSEVTRPNEWGGYILSPQLIEFWQGRANRLHDRLQYTFVNENWKIERLAP